MATQRQLEYWESLRGKPHGHKTSNGKTWKKTPEQLENARRSRNPKSNLNMFYRAKKGQHITPSTEFRKEHTPWNKYKKAYNSGEKHPQWIAARTLVRRSDKKHLDSRYKQWMREVKNRDGWKCKMSNDDCSGCLEAHHICRWQDFPELRYEVNNGITLCHFHHPRKIDDEMKLAPSFRELIGLTVH